jgi:hypothetical protein
MVLKSRKFKQKKVYKRNTKKVKRRKYSNKKRIKRMVNFSNKVMRGRGPKRKIEAPKIYQNHQNPIIPLEDRDLYVLGGDYGYSQEWNSILQKYPVTISKVSSVKRFNKKSVPKPKIPEIIRAEMEKRKGKIRCPFGQISFNELPDYADLPRDFPYDNLLKFVIVLDADTNEFIIIWSQANILHIDYAEEYIKKYFDDNLNYIGANPENRKIPVYITPDIIEAINSEQRLRDDSFNLLWERSMNAINYNRIVTEYLTRTQGFNPATHIHLLPRPEVSHSCLANNFNGHNLKLAEDGQANIYGGFEAVIFDNTIIVNDQSGHYQTNRNTLITLLKDLLEAKGYTGLVILVPPPDKPHYRTYITNNPDIYQNAVSGIYNEAAYNEARRTMGDANRDANSANNAQVNPPFSQDIDMDII